MKQLLGRVNWIWVLIGWTVFLWLSRLRNVVNNDDLTSTGRAIRVGVVVIFVALAGATAVALRRGYPRVVALFLAWTVGYWLIRGGLILVDGDYSIAFRAIHTVLMLVSLVLAFLSFRSAQQLGAGR